MTTSDTETPPGLDRADPRFADLVAHVDECTADENDPRWHRCVWQPGAHFILCTEGTAIMQRLFGEIIDGETDAQSSPQVDE